MLVNTDKPVEFKKYVGVGNFKVVGVNPDPEKAKQGGFVTAINCGGKYDENTEFHGVDDDGNKWFRLIFAVESVGNKQGNGEKFLIGIGDYQGKVIDKKLVTQAGVEVIYDKYNKTWAGANEPEDWFDKDSGKPVKPGQVELQKFLLAWVRPTKKTLKESGVDAVLNIPFDDLFKGKFKEFRETIKGVATTFKEANQPNIVRILLGIRSERFYTVYTETFGSIYTKDTTFAKAITGNSNGYGKFKAEFDNDLSWHNWEGKVSAQPDEEPVTTNDSTDTGSNTEEEDDLPF